MATAAPGEALESARGADARHRTWRDPAMQMGLGLEVVSVALGIADREYLAGGFLLGGLLLVVSSTFGPRLLKGKIHLTGMEFELAKEDVARAVTTTIASTPEQPIEVGPDEEDDAMRSLLSDVLLERLFESHPWTDLEDCRFQLYLYDPDVMMLLPILDRDRPGPSPGFTPHQGTVGACWATGEYIVATGAAVWDDTFNLTPELQDRFRDTTVAASVPVTNGAGRMIGVISGSSMSPSSALATPHGLEVQIFLAEAAARVLVDLLKWFSDGYDATGVGGRERSWAAR